MFIVFQSVSVMEKERRQRQTVLSTFMGFLSPPPENRKVRPAEGKWQYINLSKYEALAEEPEARQAETHGSLSAKE